MMHHVPQAGLTALAVAGPVERGVRPHCAARAYDRISVASVIQGGIVETLENALLDKTAALTASEAPPAMNC
jgi:hypothetical protein